MRAETENGQMLCETAAVYGWSEYTGIHALAYAVNSLAAAGAEDTGAKDFGVGIRITYPSHAEKSGIYKMEKRVKKECRRRGIRVLESRIFEQPLLKVPSVTVNGIALISGESVCGRKLKDSLPANSRTNVPINIPANISANIPAGIPANIPVNIPAGADIVLSGHVGTDGMLQAVREREEEFSRRFSPAFIRQILSHEEELFAVREAKIGREFGADLCRQITQGGIFAALWELAGELGMGLETDLKRFSILQETVEVCEYFRLNPYQLASAGSFLFVTADGEGLREAFRREGIAASVIGKVTEGQKKVIRNGEDVRCIDRPAPDEIWKLHDMQTA